MTSQVGAAAPKKARFYCLSMTPQGALCRTSSLVGTALGTNINPVQHEALQSLTDHGLRQSGRHVPFCTTTFKVWGYPSLFHISFWGENPPQKFQFRTGDARCGLGSLLTDVVAPHMKTKISTTNIRR